MNDVQQSNSLADLAARIRAEHEAAAIAMQRGLKHAMAAGKLLIEAKAQLNKHGQWLPWLAAHCAMSERTAQAYMRVARGFAEIGDEAKAQLVADLSFRDSLKMLAVAGSVAASMPAESFERVSELAGDVGLRDAISRVRRKDMMAGFTLDTPRSMLPPPGNRLMRVARNPTKRQWLLAIGPDVSRETLMQREQLARESEAVRVLQQEQDDLKARADELEAEAKLLRTDADDVGREIGAAVKNIVGPVSPFTETFDFQCDDTTDAELASLPQAQLVGRLLAARGSADGELIEIDRGYWGDMNQMGYQPMQPGPGAWTKLGSPEWLETMFRDEAAPHDDERSARA